MSTDLGALLHEPSPEQLRDSNLGSFAHWLQATRGLTFASYDALQS